MGSDAPEPKRQSLADDTRVSPGVQDDDTRVLDSAEETTVPTAAGRSGVDDSPPRGFLVARSLSAEGPDGTIFNSVSLKAQRGELVAIVGDAGTGRTALLLTLSGRYRQQGGTLVVGGDARPARIRELVAVASAPPAVVADDNHTVSAVLTESALIGGVEEAEVRLRCEDLGLRLDSGLAFGQLARVEQTLLILASAWAQDTPGIAIDDFDSGVDDSGTARLWEAARLVADDDRLVLATAVRAGTATDRVVRPRPLDIDNNAHVIERESSR